MLICADGSATIVSGSGETDSGVPGSTADRFKVDGVHRGETEDAPAIETCAPARGECREEPPHGSRASIATAIDAAAASNPTPA
jgi:hypothetical protein